MSGNIWTEGVSNQMDSYQLMHDIHMLLVDHETESLVNTVRLLEVNQYRVTIVELASAAIQLLNSGIVKYDVIMANVSSPDLHGYKLVQHAVSMEIPVILMSSDDNTFLATKALETGAFLYVKKPVTTEMIGYLWQHVLREKRRMIKDRERLASTNYQSRAIELEKGTSLDEGNHNNVGSNGLVMMRYNGKAMKKNREITNGFNANEGHNDAANNKLNRKMCTEWTQELHAKFVSAIKILGEGRCFPREILKLMNVPGLTRMQVASHLQKCRNKNWRAPEEQRVLNQALVVGSSDTGGSHSKPRRFGLMPEISKAMHQKHVVKLGSQVCFGTESGMQGSMGNNIVHHQQDPSFSQAGPSRVSSNGRNQSEEVFNIPGMDSTMVQDFYALPQGFGMNTASQNHGQYHYDAMLYAEQQVASMNTTSPWSLEKSNFENEGPDTRGHE